MLNNMPINTTEKMESQDVDDLNYNSVYSALRSGSIDDLETLINDKWLRNSDSVSYEKLDEILSRAYEELKLKHVPLTDAMEIFVENKLINLRFFSNAKKQVQGNKHVLGNIKERVKLVLENIHLIKTEYEVATEKDARFLLIAKFISQNIHILKRQLRSTYVLLPWEEMEYCLVSFITSIVKQQELNLFIHSTINKCKLLNYLETFANILESKIKTIRSTDVGKLHDLPKSKREEVVSEIISNCPQFEQLYQDYEKIRDIHSLERISNYINLALSTDPKKKQGQLTIARVLQVLGEYFKNTLESPKLSNSTSELLLLSLPRNTRDIIIDLRNSLSHATSLSKRIEVEENSNSTFFLNIQNDVKKIGNIITDILLISKIKPVQLLLQLIISSKSFDQVKGIAIVLNNVQLNTMMSENFNVVEMRRIESLVAKLNNLVAEKTKHEQDILDQIKGLINIENAKLQSTLMNYNIAVGTLKSFSSDMKDNKFDENVIRAMKLRARYILHLISPKLESHNLEEIVKLTYKFSYSIKSRIEYNLELESLFSDIFFIAKFGINDFKWIAGLKDKLFDNDFPVSVLPKQDKLYILSEETYKKHLEVKLLELKNILRNNSLNNQSYEKLHWCKNDKQLHVVLEMLLLDIMSLLDSSKRCLENNLFFLDENAPLLTGKCLRNHLAHDNTLVQILLHDPSLAVMLNAIKLTTEEITVKKKVGKLVRDNPLKLKVRYEQNLSIVTNQEKMFAALEEGNFQTFKNCLENGADIKAISLNSWTALHFAAKGSDVETIKFILNQDIDSNVKDGEGRTPLHVAAAYGRRDIIEYFIRNLELDIQDIDNMGKTVLHIAAQNGNLDTVEFLLEKKVIPNIHDLIGLSPVYYAIRNGHTEIAKMLLQKDKTMDGNKVWGGFTPLHEASESGYLEIVNFLLENKADVDAKNDRSVTPLHLASLNGHLSIVEALIKNKADVNAKDVKSCVPLYYAVENGHENVVNALLKHRINVNVADRVSNYTALHFAAEHGHENIVKSLLESKALTNIMTVEGNTPLHLAVQNGHLGIVTAILKHRVDINAKDRSSQTPLHLAAENGNKAIVELLIKNKAAVNDKATNGFTPLHFAALREHIDIIYMLIKNKADIDARDAYGNTPLFSAAANGSEEVIEVLIKHNAEVSIRNKSYFTPLHTAALNGRRGAVDLLLKNGAKVDSKAKSDFTSLHAAALEGHIDVIECLIKHNAKVNAKGIDNCTPLHSAVEGGYKQAVEILIKNGANINARSNGITPLLTATTLKNKDIVEVLIANGADISIDGSKPLFSAVHAGFDDIVKILLNNNADVNIKSIEDMTLLHVAARGGSIAVTKALLEKGANVNAIATNNLTPLYIAADAGHDDIVELFLANGSDATIKTVDGETPLHVASTAGHINVVNVLLKNGVSIDMKDEMNRTPVELAVAHGHFEIVKILLHHQNINLNAKGSKDWTILHIAAQGENLDIVKYLVQEGCDINAENSSGSKPIHIAAREGQKDIVAFFISKGCNINDVGASNQTLLHYAAMKGHLKVVKYLIAKGINVGAKDNVGLTAVHIAACFGFKNIIETLLKNGASYNGVDMFNRSPVRLASSTDVVNMLSLTEELFEAVNCNDVLKVERCIKQGACADARNNDNETCFHIAVLNSYEHIVNILLQYKCNPNVYNNNGFTPLHLAAKFSHLQIVKALLSYGAIHDAVSYSGKIPLDLAVDRGIIKVLKLVNESFQNVKNGNSKVIVNLNKINDTSTIKAVMNCCNKENQTLVVSAMHCNFPKVQQLKEVSQGDVADKLFMAASLVEQDHTAEALGLLKSILKMRTEILGPDNPGTLDVQVYIAKVIHKQGAYQQALNMLEEIFKKQKKMLGLNAEDTLSTRSMIALTLHKQGQDDEALNIYQDVYQKQKALLGPYHSDVLDTQLHLALVLDRQGKYDEALIINQEIFRKRRETLGAHHPASLRVQNNIGLVLTNQGKYDEALELYKEVYERKKEHLGVHHSDTLRTLYNIAGVLSNQGKHEEALKYHEDILSIQKKVLGPNHPDTLITQHNIANIFLAQGKWTTAVNAYTENFDQKKAVLGSNHPSVLEISSRLEQLNLLHKIGETGEISNLDHFQNDMISSARNGDVQSIENILKLGTSVNGKDDDGRMSMYNRAYKNTLICAAKDGDVQVIEQILKGGADINEKDANGRTPLHYAIYYGYIEAVDILLKNGADVTQVTNKGNTPLHTATSNHNLEIIKLLLQYVNRSKLNDFINAQTTGGGTTSLHIAAKTNSLDIVITLLKHGAIYNIENKERETPFCLSTDEIIMNLLNITEQLFDDARNGNDDIINKLKTLNADEFLAITNVRNRQGNTLLQVAVTNKYKSIANGILEMLKKAQQNGKPL